MAAFELLARKAIMSVAQNRAVRSAATRHGMRLGAARFVAGEDLHTALRAVAELNRVGIWGTLDHLGEFVSDPGEATAAADACLAVLDGIHQSGCRCNLSLKLTQLGLDIDPDLCRENLRRIVSRAGQYDNFVRVDMEESSRTDLTLQLVAEMRDEFGPQRIGTVIQAYLFRSASDLVALAQHGTNVRLVKGAYMEPPEVAFAAKPDVDVNFAKLIRQYLDAGMYTAVATHDEQVIRTTKEYVTERSIDHDRFEFQMLYGIRRDLQRQLADEGYRVRVYIPYGTDWYGYFARRLAERPANVMFVLGNLFKP
jgi:proline dehydrogenase